MKNVDSSFISCIMKCMEKFSRKIKETFSDKRKRTMIVGTGIAVATAIAGIVTLTIRGKKKK